MIAARAQNTFLYHLPHLLGVGIGLIAFLYLWLRQALEARGRAREARAAAPAPDPVLPAAPVVRRSVARRGLVALGPLLAAVGTGAVIYGINLGAGRPSGGVIWVHSGLSVLALLLVAYKLAELGAAGLRRGLRPGALLRAGSSLVLAALFVPLLVSGVLLLAAPSKGSFTTYLHLIASAWWTLLLAWHLRRYLGPALRRVLLVPQPPSTGGAEAIPRFMLPVAQATGRQQPTSDQESRRLG